MSVSATPEDVGPALRGVHDAVLAARERIGDHVSRTDVVRLPWLDAPGREVYAKLECHQRTGSFKLRGALNAALDGSDAPLVTASAGNHALALLAAAHEAGRDCTIFVPATVSALKLERLAAGRARIVQVGRDLHAAAGRAIAHADRTGAVYVSAYGSAPVVAGQGTCAVELDEQAGPFDAVMVPLGGGGLLTGIGAYLSVARPETRIVAVHPAIYGRRSASDSLAGALRRPVVPSIADGLGVQATAREDGFGGLIDALTDEDVGCDERTIQLAIHALLQRESILAEGAGAIAVGALLRDPEGERFRGRIALVVSGGNITAARVAEALAVTVSDPAMRTVLGLRGAQLGTELPLDPRPTTARATPADAADGVAATPDGVPLPGTDPAVTPAGRAGEVWRAVVDRAGGDLEAVAEDLGAHAGLAARLGLDVDPALLRTVEEQVDAARTVRALCDATPGDDVRLPARARTLLHACATARQTLEWCSPSLDESRAVQFFDSATRAGSVPYSRYGFPALQDLEVELVDVLGLDPGRVAACVTSSGMAAFAVVEAFLTREVLAPGDAVAYAPYIYFEAAEHFERLPHLRHVHAPGFGVEELADAVEEADARVLFVDPVANIRDLPAVDLIALGRRARGGGWRDRWVVIDGTLVSGGLDPFAWFDRDDGPRVILYESASKYLQLGSDMQMAGVVLADAGLSAPLHRHRRNTGATLYEGGVFRFPRVGREHYLARNRCLTANAEAFVAALDGVDAPMTVGFPRRWRDLGWAHGGGLASVVFDEEGLNNRVRLEGLIDDVLTRCRAAGLRLTKGVSFGFATSRLSASAAMAADADPFLRFSFGEEPGPHGRVLAEIVADAIGRHVGAGYHRPS